MWTHWFSVRYAAVRNEIFGINALREKLHQLRFTKFAGYLHWGVKFSGTKIILILKNKMATVGIYLKIIYIFSTGCFS